MKDEIREKLQKEEIDVDNAVGRFMGNEALYMKYLFCFLDEGSYQVLCRAFADKDCQAAFAAAHTLKGICGNLSIIKMESVLKDQVEYLREGDLDKAEKLMQPLEEAYEQVIDTLVSLKDKQFY